MSAFDGQTIKDLNDRYDEAAISYKKSRNEAQDLGDRLRPIQSLRDQAQARAVEAQRLMHSIEAEIRRRQAPKPEPTVTDHALLRYIERVHEIDLDALRAHILNNTVRAAIAAGAALVKTDGFSAKITGNSIVTITVPEPEHHRKPHRLTRAQRERMEGYDDSDHMLVGDGPGSYRTDMVY